MANRNRNEQRLARELQRAEGISYMKALRRIREQVASAEAENRPPSPERPVRERPQTG